MNIGSITSIVNRKDIALVNSELSEDVLSINCRRCGGVPEFRSPGCIRCVVRHIAQQGNAARIRLRTSKDMELFGPAAEILCELAVFHRSAPAGTGKGDGRGCSDCINSCQRIMEVAWSSFPEPDFDSARGRLASFRPTDGRCNSCIQRTYRALDQAEHGINNLKKKISVETARTGGV